MQCGNCLNGAVTLGDFWCYYCKRTNFHVCTFNGGFDSGQTIDFNANRLTEVSDATQAQDSTKAYVDHVKSGLDVKIQLKSQMASEFNICKRYKIVAAH